MSWYQDRDFPEVKESGSGKIIAVVPDAIHRENIIREHNALLSMANKYCSRCRGMLTPEKPVVILEVKQEPEFLKDLEKL